MEEFAESPDLIDFQFDMRKSGMRPTLAFLLDTAIQTHDRKVHQRTIDEHDPLQDEGSKCVRGFMNLFNLHGIFIDVGIEPLFAISAGSRTSIRSFSGWLGKSLTSS